MTAVIFPTSPATPRSVGRRGFSFAEVLFAVLILGIGFIMVAAIFPVALTQTKAVGEETNAAAVSRGAINQLQQVLQNPSGTIKLPGTCSLTNEFLPQLNQLQLGQSITLPGMVMGLRENSDPGSAGNPRVPQRSLSRMFLYLVRQTAMEKKKADPSYIPPNNSQMQQEAQRLADELWRAVKGNVILPSDHQYAWVPLFRRDVIATCVDANASGYDRVRLTRAPIAQVFIIAVESRGGAGFTEQRDLFGDPKDSGKWPATLDAKIVDVELTNNPTDNKADFVRFKSDADAQRVAEGAFLIVSDDDKGGKVDGGNTQPGVLNGRILRLGNQVSPGNNLLWEIAPGSDFPFNERGFASTGGPEVRKVLALMVGRPYSDPVQGPSGGYDGPALDVAIYTAFVSVND